MRVCTRCGAIKELDDFYCGTSYRRRVCKTCCIAVDRARIAARRAAGDDPIRRKILRQYGLTPESFDALLVAQGGRCGVCSTTEPGGRWQQWHVDHDHRCCPTRGSCCGNCVRGLLCGVCNQRLAPLEDGDFVARALAYLGKETLP